MLRGFSSKEIGSRLDLSTNSVRKIKVIIYLKTGTHSALELVATIKLAA